MSHSVNLGHYPNNNYQNQSNEPHRNVSHRNVSHPGSDDDFDYHLDVDMCVRVGHRRRHHRHLSTTTSDPTRHLTTNTFATSTGNLLTDQYVSQEESMCDEDYKLHEEVGVGTFLAPPRGTVSRVKRVKLCDQDNKLQFNSRWV